MGGKESQPVPYAKSRSIRAERWLGCEKGVTLWRTGISETAKLQSIYISSDLNHHCIPQGLERKEAVYPLLLLPPKLSPAALPFYFRGTALLPPPLSDFTMGCLFPGTPFCLRPTTCSLVWLHKQVPHIFATRAPSGLSQAHQPPRPPFWVGVHSLQSLLFSGNRLLCSSLNVPLKKSFAVLPTKIWTATRKWYLSLLCWSVLPHLLSYLIICVHLLHSIHVHLHSYYLMGPGKAFSKLSG